MPGSQLGQTFDATQVEPATGKPPPLPDDWYNVLITESENKRSKNNPKNTYTEVVLKVADGPYSGRLAWDRLNLWNENPAATEIAQKTLSAMCHATGVFQIDAVSELHGIPLMAKIVEVDPEGGYDAKNDVKGYAAYGAKASSNGQGIKLEPRNNDTTPATPGAPSAATPTFVPPAAPTAAVVPPVAPPAAPPAEVIGGVPTTVAPAAWAPGAAGVPVVTPVAPAAVPPVAPPPVADAAAAVPPAAVPPAAPPAEGPPAAAPWATPPPAV